MATVIIPAFPDKDAFVFIPACCYGGNQFPVLKYGYPPMFRPGDAALSMPVTITDVPRLAPDGSGKIEVTVGDAATPCIGVFSPGEKRGLLVFTPQQIRGQNIGLAYEGGNIRLTWPARREQHYRICRMIPNDTPWTDEDARIPYIMFDIFENFCCFTVRGVIINFVTIVNKTTVIATFSIPNKLSNSYNKLNIHPKIVANGPKKPPTLVNNINSNSNFLLKKIKHG